MRSCGGDAYAGAVRGAGGGMGSSRVRELIGLGEVGEVAALVGRADVVRGEVVVGDRRGRRIGFPTANVVADAAVVVPARGVYAGFVGVGKAVHPACTNVGVAPTFRRGESRIEAYLIGFRGNLYGRVVDVSFVRRVRPEMRFSGLEELKEQIARDVEEARRITSGTI